MRVSDTSSAGTAASIAEDQHKPSDLQKWDVLVLTARNAAQKHIFQQELSQLQTVLAEFCDKFIVLADDDDDADARQQNKTIRIGSGGATLNALLRLEQRHQHGRAAADNDNFFGTHRVLLLHSGGLSQRIPHVALIGKAFMLMPDGRTLLEHKLHMYSILLHGLQSLPYYAGGFVFIASADVLEHFSEKAIFDVVRQNLKTTNCDELLLLTHHSQLEVAIQHGVYVLQKADNVEEGATILWRVLQKPSMQQLCQIPDAIVTTTSRNPVTDKVALTDSCYLLAGNLAAELLALRKQHGRVQCELCCYRDFLCPLGATTDQDQKKAHFTSNDPVLLKWQQLLWEKMHSRSARLLHLGLDSFFHFGTVPELLQHFLDRSLPFWCKFLNSSAAEKSNVVNCIVESMNQISCRSFLEWCHLTGDCSVGDGCILSGLCWLEEEHDEHKQEQHKKCVIPSNVCAVTVPIERSGKENCGIQYVTVCFPCDADLKANADNGRNLQWFEQIICFSEHTSELTLWDYPLFRSAKTATQSLRNTLWTIEHGLESKRKNHEDSAPLLSISQVFEYANVPEMLLQREMLKKQAKILQNKL